MYKVLALDLDGTVLTDDHTIHPDVQKAIQKAQQTCHVVIVTGRHHTAARPYYQQLGLSTPIICCNGTYLYDYASETVLQANAIALEHAEKFISLSLEHQMKLVMYVEDSMTYSRTNPVAYMQALSSWAEQYPIEIRPKVCQIESFYDTARETRYIWKFVVEGSIASVERLTDNPWVTHYFDGERSWANRVDFAAKGNSKGRRLSEYVNRLGFDVSDVLAIGDNHNDISMLEVAGLGVAMRNADEIVQSKANLVLDTDNNGTGIADLIEQYIY